MPAFLGARHRRDALLEQPDVEPDGGRAVRVRAHGELRLVPVPLEHGRSHDALHRRRELPARVRLAQPRGPPPRPAGALLFEPLAVLGGVPCEVAQSLLHLRALRSELLGVRRGPQRAHRVPDVPPSAPVRGGDDELLAGPTAHVGVGRTRALVVRLFVERLVHGDLAAAQHAPLERLRGVQPVLQESERDEPVRPLLLLLAARTRHHERVEPLAEIALVPGFGQTADHRGAAAGAGARAGRAGGRSRGGGRRGGLGRSRRSVRGRLHLSGCRRCALGGGDVGRGRRWRSGGGGGHVRLLDAGTLRLLRLRLGLGGALRRAPRRSSRDRHRTRAADVRVALDACVVRASAGSLFDRSRAFGTAEKPARGTFSRDFSLRAKTRPRRVLEPARRHTTSRPS